MTPKGSSKGEMQKGKDTGGKRKGKKERENVENVHSLLSSLSLSLPHPLSPIVLLLYLLSCICLQRCESVDAPGYTLSLCILLFCFVTSAKKKRGEKKNEAFLQI